MINVINKTTIKTPPMLPIFFIHYGTLNTVIDGNTTLDSNVIVSTVSY